MPKLSDKIWAIALLLGTVFLAYSIRVGNRPLLEGRYLLDTDSYRFLRQADLIASEGRLPKVDTMRWVPLGRDLSRDPSLWSYGLAGSYRLLHMFWPQLTVYQVACYSGLVAYLACLVLLFLLWKRLFDTSMALLAVNLLVGWIALGLRRLGNRRGEAFAVSQRLRPGLFTNASSYFWRASWERC